MRILVTGGTGMVGKHLEGKLPWPETTFVGSKDYDLTNQAAVQQMFRDLEPTAVVHLAARVGGIQDNIANPIDFLQENVLMNTNVVSEAYKHGVNKFIGVLSTCIYPDRVNSYPMSEVMLHGGPPTPTNFGYGYAKRLLGVQLETIRNSSGRDYFSIIPCNLYSETDHFGNETKAHFVTALLKKIKTAVDSGSDKINLFGTGTPYRQFMHANDLAKVISKCIGRSIKTDFNICNGDSLTIRDIAELALKATGNEHLKLEFDLLFKNDGQFRKCVSNDKFKELFPKYEFLSLEDGLSRVYKSL